jgi:hypothetical protein
MPTFSEFRFIMKIYMPINDKLKKVKNASIRLNVRLPSEMKKNQKVSSVFTVLKIPTFQLTNSAAFAGSWHKSRFFFFFNLRHYISNGSYVNSPLPTPLYTIPSFFCFDLETCIWSELQLNVSPNKYMYFLNIDSEGVLNILNYGGTEVTPLYELNTFEYDVTLSRIPVG